MEKAVSELMELSEDHIILVEGKKDVRALTALGLGDAEMYEVQSGGGPLRAAETVFESGRKAVIMTDWDTRGNMLADELGRQLSALCVDYDSDIRYKLGIVCKKDIKDIESLPKLYSRLRDAAAESAGAKNV
jgi:5S rRNA maturation endonuclease (ribonuclease M5)